MVRISAVVNTLNEERHVVACLERLGWADEIVVVDMYSADRTVELARGHTHKLFFHEPTGYVEPARNFAIGKATGDWVLVVDADELVPPRLADKLKQIASIPGRVAGVRIPRTTYNFGRPTPHISLYPDSQLRFFQRGAVAYSDEIHQPPKVVGEILDLPAGEGYDIEHRPEVLVGGLVARWERYAAVEAQAMYRRGVQFRWDLHLIREPLREFRYRFFRCRGYKDGTRGLVLAGLHAFQRFSVGARLWELSGYAEEGDIEIEGLAGERRALLRALVEVLMGRLAPGESGRR